MKQWLVMLSLGALLAVGGCVGKCKHVQETLSAHKRQTTSFGGSVVSMTVRLASFNETLAKADFALETTVPMPLFAAKLLGPEMRFAPDRIEFLPAIDGKPQARLTIEASAAEDVVLSQIALDFSVQHRFERDGDRAQLVLFVAGEDLQGVRPLYHRDIAAKLREFLLEKVDVEVPALAAPLADRVAQQLMEYVSNAAFRAIKPLVLTRIEGFELQRIDIPPVPMRVDDVVSSDTESMTLLLAVRGTHGRLSTREPKLKKDEHWRVHATPQALLAAANWVVDKKMLPPEQQQEVNEKLKGRKIFFAWQGHAQRPLKAHLLKTDGGCSHVVVGMQINATLSDGRLTAGVSEGVIEEVQGPMWYEWAAAVKRTFTYAVSRHKQVRAELTKSVAGAALELKLTHVRVGNGVIEAAGQIAPVARKDTSDKDASDSKDASDNKDVSG